MNLFPTMIGEELPPTNDQTGACTHLDGQELGEGGHAAGQQVAAEVQGQAQLDGLKQDGVLRVGLVGVVAARRLAAGCGWDKR
jgi:hypothetical protein